MYRCTNIFLTKLVRIFTQPKMATLQSNIDTGISEDVVRSLGYHRLKEKQRIDFVSENDVFAILPTGFGKTLFLFIYVPLGIESRFCICVDQPYNYNPNIN